MGIKTWLPLLLAALAANLGAASIDYKVTSLGGNVFSYSYILSGLTFQQNQELDLEFDPTLYGTLSNGVAGSGFNLLLLQPNNPPGTTGDYSALALAANPSLAGPFSVDFIFKGPGSPGSQPYTINQFDSTGAFVSTLGSGFTTPAGGAPIPEPASVILSTIALLAYVLFWSVRRPFGRASPAVD